MTARSLAGGFYITPMCHTDKQPFTRELDGLVIPHGVKVIIVEAHDMVHEYGGKVVRVDITKTKGENYRIRKLK